MSEKAIFAQVAELERFRYNDFYIITEHVRCILLNAFDVAS